MQGLLVAALAPLWLLAATQAIADPRAAAHVDEMFRLADTNRDEVISEAESHAAIAVEFRKHDIDGDGLLHYAEIARQQLEAGASQLAPDIRRRVLVSTFAMYEQDLEAGIPLERYQQVQHALLLQADTDQDGEVSLREARVLHRLEAP